MGTITSGVGLISGINTGQLIDSLIAIDARPQQLLQQQNTLLQTKETAFQSISAQLLALKLSTDNLTTGTLYNATTATSSNPSVLTATTNAATTPGTYSFTVARLVSTQQDISNGFADADQTPLSPGTLTFDFGDSKLTTDTSLNQLNAGQGVARGRIRITDRSGASAVVDLSQALTIGDVLDAINNTSGINVTASVGGDGFRLTDSSGGAGAVSVANVGTTGTAASLGLTTGTFDAAAGVLSGAAVNRIGAATSLAALNDGTGVRIKGVVPDFSIARRDGTSFDVTLDGAGTIGDVIGKINAASGGSVTASVSADGTGIKLVDTSTPDGSSQLTVAALNGSNAAADLGILGSDTGGTGSITGGRVIAQLGSRLLKNLRGGQGIGLGTISITPRSGAGNAFTVDLSGAQSVSDVIGLINQAGSGQGISVGLNSTGRGLVLTDSTGAAASNLIVSDVSGTAAADLGLAGSVAADSIEASNLQLRDMSESTRLSSLNGGQGVAAGKFTITDSRGVSATVDLTGSGNVTIANVLANINSRGLEINARINDNGDGILIEDTGPGATAISVQEAGSTTAHDLGILGTASSAGANLDGSLEKTITIPSFTPLAADTALTTLNGGKGVGNVVGQADFSVTRADGSSFQVNLDGATTVQNVIDAINAASGGNVTASISPGSAGLQLVDTSSGTGKLTVAALNGSTAASDLGFGSAATLTSGTLQGSALVDATTLTDLVQKINDAGMNVRATVINDGSSTNPYRLSLVSTQSGKAGEFTFDDGGLGFGNTTLTQGQDAAVFYGSSDPAKAVAITSTTNSLKAVIPGVTVSLLGTSTGPVQLTVARDDSGISSGVKKFVDSFNSVVDTLDKFDTYDPTSQQAGLLLGDSTLSQIRSSLYRYINGVNGQISTQFKTLSQVGIKVIDGAKLSLDATKLDAALSLDRNAVQQLFSFKTTATGSDGKVTTTAAGTGVQIDQLLSNLTDPNTGLIHLQVNGLDAQVKLNTGRINQMQTLLDAKRKTMQQQFNQMEQTLATLQQQGTALGSLSSILASTAAYTSSSNSSSK